LVLRVISNKTVFETGFCKIERAVGSKYVCFELKMIGSRIFWTNLVSKELNLDFFEWMKRDFLIRILSFELVLLFQIVKAYIIKGNLISFRMLSLFLRLNRLFSLRLF